jgi:hypothetical protein
MVMFGTIFNDISISRTDNTNVEIQKFKVPLAYGPAQKFLSKVKQDPEFKAPAIVLPRMSFEIMSMEYDGTRAQSSLQNVRAQAIDASYFKKHFYPAPYDIQIELNIMAKYPEDALKIVEQILPFFKPQWTSSVRLIDDLEIYWDVPIILNSVTSEDQYEGTFEERRILTWTLQFTLKGYYFGPVTNKKVIKFANTSVYGTMTSTDLLEKVTVQPGLTANGTPTTDITQTIPFTDIKLGDDWDYIVKIE